MARLLLLVCLMTACEVASAGLWEQPQSSPHVIDSRASAKATPDDCAYVWLKAAELSTSDVVHALKQMPGTVSAIAISSFSGDWGQVFQEVAALNCTYLYLGNAAIDDSAFAALSKATQLESLGLWGCAELTQEVFSHLAEVPNLRTLDIGGIGVRWEAMSGIDECKKLTKLYLSNSAIGTKAAAALSKCKNLTLVDLESARLDEAIDIGALFASLGELETLSLAGVHTLSGVVMRRLASLEKLNYLDVSRCGGLRDEAVAQLAGSKSLKTLRLDGLDINGQCLAEIAEMKALSYLSLSETSLDGSNLQLLAPSKSLNDLALDSCSGISEAAIEAYVGGASAKITGLSLINLPVTDEVFEKLGTKLSSLESLNLMHCKKITDRTLSVIVENCKGLRKLNVALTAVTRTGLLDLKSCSALRRLVIGAVWASAKDFIDELAAALPNADIFVDDVE